MAFKTEEEKLHVFKTKWSPAYKRGIKAFLRNDEFTECNDYDDLENDAFSDGWEYARELYELEGKEKASGILNKFIRS